MTIGDIKYWFPDELMTKFKNDAPKEYAEIMFNLGYSMWGKYDGSTAESMKAAMPYFEKVLSVAQGEKAGKYAGLTEKQFNLAKAFYAVSFFQINREYLKENARFLENKC